MAVPKIVHDLVERFRRNREDYEAPSYKEAQLRQEFIDPLLKALGWDVDNEQGFAEAYKDVIHEDAIKVSGSPEAPDYCLRIGGNRKFFFEAKKPAENLKQDTSHAFQLRRYGWSSKLPLSILSSFGEWAVYDCRIKPDKEDKASVGRVEYFTFEELAEKWDEFAGIFSREAVLKGSFDKYAETNKKKRGTAEVDAAFLAEIEDWRAELAKNLALRNEKLDTRDLNFAVQRIMDRIIFLRIAEDRGIEDYGRLQALLNGENVYRRLGEMFRRADERYNSGIFHFEPEKDRAEPPDELTLSLEIDDKVLKEIIKHLYYPESPYEFSVLSADILGQVYEQFLGKVISLTAGHRAKVEEKPEVKKAGGVYYTPTYIVDYIVEQTVGKLLEGKTPKQAAKLKILDPACGSGSFLIGAYQYLLDWHLKWYIENEPGNRKEVYQDHTGATRLTIAERKRILLNNIYGVDIDSQAVEVTKLSLLLKVLEGASRDVLERQRKLFHERALPDLGKNIKCGNSLIGPDFYNGQQLAMFDEEERYRLNVFDWRGKDGFPEIMKSGGFDAVIGNPPWGATFAQSELAYLRLHYRAVIARMIDSYIYFVSQSSKVANQQGIIGFIIPSTLLNQTDARPIRELLLRRGLENLVNVGQGVFGTQVLNTSTIFVSAPHAASGKVRLNDVSRLPLLERPAALNNGRDFKWSDWSQQVGKDPHLTFFVSGFRESAILTRLRSRGTPLEAMVDGSIQRGVSPDVVGAHVLTSAEAKRAKLEADLLRPSISGAQIKRYAPWRSDQFIIYTERETPIKKYPRCFDYLKQFRDQNTCKEVIDGKHPWWCLHRPRDSKIFASPKFIGLTTTRKIELILDEHFNLCVTDAMYVFRLRQGIDPYASLALLHSSTFLFLYRVANQGESRVIPQIKASKLETIPFPESEKFNRAAPILKSKCKTMLDLHQQLAKTKPGHAKTVIERQIEATDRQIDQLVYELYGLTDDEIRLVEEATA